MAIETKRNDKKARAGAVLLIVAGWVFMTQTDFTSKYASGTNLGILALDVLYTGIKEEK